MSRQRGNKKTQVIKESSDRLQNVKDSYFSFLELCKLLFANQDIFEISQIDQESKYYDSAKRMAKSIDIDWDNMSHEDSNRIMLAMLEDYYKKMSEVAQSKDITINVTFRVLQ